MNYIVDDIGAAVAAMRNPSAKDIARWNLSEAITQAEAPFYMYGHRAEISDRLTEKVQSKTYKFKKYPLIALRMDFTERIAEKAGMIELNLNIVILAFTDKNKDAEWRMTNVFKPKLYPLYNFFTYKLRTVGKFSFNSLIPEHTKIDRPYWGIEGAEGNSANIFNDPLDAIEIQDLKIYSRINYC